MFKKFEYVENFILTLKKYFNNFSILFVILLFLSGFLGPNPWKIVPFEFNFSKFQRNFTKQIKNFEKLDKFETTRNYLSNDQINDKKIVLAWSNKIHKKIENNKPLPRMYFSHIPNNIHKYEIHEKKKVFLSLLLPIALRGNELVLQERKLIDSIFKKNNIYKIEYFSKKYKVKNFKKINYSNLTNNQLTEIKKELLIKINKIPISMILAQAIIESGWGSSRFAKEGHALFGEWTWENDVGIKPKENLDANFSVKKFKNLLESMNSYILNLNRHPAYKNMRSYRDLMNKTDKIITGYDTANYLESYAEIGFAYVTKVIKMIKSNKLTIFENVKLEIYSH